MEFSQVKNYAVSFPKYEETRDKALELDIGIASQ